MIFGDSISKAFKVTGVAAAFPKAHAQKLVKIVVTFYSF